MGRRGEGEDENAGPGTASPSTNTIYLQFSDIDETCRGLMMFCSLNCVGHSITPLSLDLHVLCVAQELQSPLVFYMQFQSYEADGEGGGSLIVFT